MPFGILKALHHYDYFITGELTLPVQALRRRKVVGTKGSLSHLINQLMTEVFVEQPLALPGSAENLVGETVGKEN